MTALHVIQTVASMGERTGGPARTIRSLCEALARRGARTDLVTGYDAAGDDPVLRPDAALVATHLVQPGRMREGFAAAFAGAVPARTIVHDNGIWNAASRAATGAARNGGLPYVISPHGMLEPWALGYHRWRKAAAWALFQRRALAGARGLVATAEQELAGIRRRVRHTPVAVIANGIDCPPIPPDRQSRDAAQPRTLLFLSRLHPKKNLLVLLDAWADLAADPGFTDWTLRIAGPDELGHRVELAARIARLRLGVRVRLDGPVAEDDKAAAFAVADLFVLPSLSENFGIVVAEALAHGVPVVATHGAPWAMLPEAGAGWHVAPTAPALAGALRAAMALPPAARRAMGERGHALVARRFAWDHIAAQTLLFYGWLLDGGRRPDFVDA